MVEKKKIPEIRFDGFEGEWEEKRFDEYYTVKSGYAFDAKDYIDEGVPIINGESITPNKIVNLNFNFLPYEYLNKYKDSIIKPGDIVLGLNRPIISNELKIARIPKTLENSLLYQRAGKIEYKKNISADYSFYLLNNEIYKFTVLEATGSDQPFISTNKLKKWSFYIADKNEQNEIGKILALMDNIIDLNEKELKHLQSYKQSMLQKMFPKQGKKVPEIRFEGFEGEWKEKRLGKIGSTFNGLSGKNKDDFNDGNSEYVSYLNVFENTFVDLNKLENVFVKEKQNTLNYGDILFTTSSETSEEVGMSSVWLGESEKVFLNSFCFGYRINNNVDYIFMGYLFRSFEFRKEVIKLAQGISRFNISKNKLMDISILIPSLTEQQQIGAFFQSLDNQIYLQEQKLETYKQLKKTLLEKMFI